MSTFATTVNAVREKRVIIKSHSKTEGGSDVARLPRPNVANAAVSPGPRRPVCPEPPEYQRGAVVAEPPSRSRPLGHSTSALMRSMRFRCSPRSLTGVMNGYTYFTVVAKDRYVTR